VGTGDKNFLKNLLLRCISENKDFYDKYLEPLFYKGFGSRERPDNDTDDVFYFPLFSCKIPYLNGGLFEKVYDWENTKVKISNQFFEDLFEFFNQYNFTVDENTLPTKKFLLIRRCSARSLKIY